MSRSPGDQRIFNPHPAQKNKATSYHVGQLKAKLAKLRRELIAPPTSGGGGGGVGVEPRPPPPPAPPPQAPKVKAIALVASIRNSLRMIIGLPLFNGRRGAARLKWR